MGMWDDEQWGCCARHTDSSAVNTKILGLCEGCVNVRNRVNDFEFITHESFACSEYVFT